MNFQELKEILKKAGTDSRFEIQIHPNHIRRGVRYIFLTRRQLTFWAMGLALFVGFLGVSASVAPGVISNLLSYREYQALISEREDHGQTLKPLVSEIEALSKRTGELRLTIDRIYLAYGLPNDDSQGQGGYPFEAEAVPASIYGTLVQEGLSMRTQVEEQLRVLDNFTREVHEFEKARRDQILTTPATCPLEADRYVLTSPFGSRRNPFTNSLDFHAGVDLAAQSGTPVHAPADGQVIFAGQVPLRRSAGWWRYGNLVVLKHGEEFVTLFAHNSEIFVRKGQQVRKGDRLAAVGNTGMSTNPHLHYEVRRRNEEGVLRPVDPRIYMLDLELSDQEKLLVARRSAPSFDDFEPLPSLIAR